MSDNVTITPGSGNVVAADEVTDGVLGQVKVQFTKLMDGTLDSTNKLVVSAAGAAKVDGSAVTQPVSGTVGISNFPATQPISGSVSVSNFPVTQPISGTVTANAGTGTMLVDGSAHTQPVSGTVSLSGTSSISGTVTAVQPTGTNLHVVVDSAPTTAVTGTFFQATQPVSAASLPLPTGAATSANQSTAQSTLNTIATNTTNAGTPTVTQGTSPWADNVSQFGGSPVVTGVGVSGAGIPRVTIASDSQVQLMPVTLCVSATAATGVGVTATLPAVAGQFHYIGSIVITKYFTVANAASATPLVVTTTNLPGSLAFSFGQPLGTVGTTDVRSDNFGFPLKSSVVNTATTIVAPATTGIIWRINVFYYAAA